MFNRIKNLVWPASTPQGFRAQIEKSYRWRTASPEQREFLLSRYAASAPAKPTATGTPAIKYPTPARSQAPAKSFSSLALKSLGHELDGLLEKATNVLARTRAEKMAGLSGLAKASAAFKAQLGNSGLAAPDGVGGEDDAVRRSKPVIRPDPPEFVETRLAQNNAYFADLMKHANDELEQATSRGRIPQELLSRIRRIDIEWKNSNDKIRGVDVRTK